jgi:hypothetical protein
MKYMIIHNHKFFWKTSTGNIPIKRHWLQLGYWKCFCLSAGLIFLLHFASPLKAQDLDPRAYVWIPVKGNFTITGFAYSKGGVVTDPTLPIDDVKASVETISMGYGRSFGILGKTAQAFVALPYSWAQASAKINGQSESLSRSGFSDIRMRVSVLLLGAPATTRANFAKVEHKTILGLSLNLIAPTGQYFSDKLINLGANRWSFRPELALSQPLGKSWQIDIYTGLWLFTNNNQYYTGKATRAQEPMGTFQGHLSYNIKRGMWVAVDATFYTGGQSSINNVAKDDRQSNSRIGATFVIPVLKQNSLKFAVSRGAIIRVGANFTTVSIGWQRSWFGKPKSN